MSQSRPIISGLRGAADDIAQWLSGFNGHFTVDVGLDPTLRLGLALLGGILFGIFMSLLALLVPLQLGWWKLIGVVGGAVGAGLIFYLVL